MKKISSLFLLFAGLIIAFTSCDDTVIEIVPPTVVGPATVQTVQAGGTVDVSFQVATPAGYASNTVTVSPASAGTVTVQSIGVGSLAGTATVTFTAGNTPGTALITFVGTDADGASATGTAAVNITATDVPAIAGIPATAEIALGGTLTVPNVVLTAADGFAASNAFTVSVDGGAAIDLSALITGDSPQTVTVSATTGDLGITAAGSFTLEFTLTDADGDVATFTHVLSVVAEIDVEGNIEADMTFIAGVTYNLNTRVSVLPGVTLTIEAGSLIKGGAGIAENATALVVARGATIMAQGTPQLPIIFTTVADDITPADIAAGNFASPNLDPSQNGFWGGVIILGSAPISVSGDEVETNIEGIPVTDPNGLYGGTDSDDNSGVFTYVSIRHGGTNIGAGNEINGLTLGGVGSGTTIENVEIVGNQDDGIEWFGGSVDITNALVWNAGDDGLDTDQDWVGTCSNFIVISPSGSAFELDGPEGTAATTSGNDHTFDGGLVFMEGVGGDAIDLDDNTNAAINGVYFFGFDSDNGTSSGDAGPITNIEFTFPATFDDDGEDDTPEVAFPDASVIFAGINPAEVSEVALNANTVGPQDATGFGWTFAAAAGVLSDIGL